MRHFGRIRETFYYCVLAVMGVGCILGGLLAFDFWLFLRLPGNSARESKEVNIRSGMNASAVSLLLYQQGVISDARKFYFLCRFRRTGQKLQAGEYAFSSFSTPGQVLDQIVSGRVAVQRVTVPEGSTVRDIARILKEKGLASDEIILNAASDLNLLRTLGIDANSLEGYLFPDTYYFNRSQDEKAILKTMVHQFWRHLPAGWQERAGELGLTLHEILTLASIVEKEAVMDSERPVIAGVFFNRLDRDMPLQSDPTAVYDLEGFSGPILWNHLKRESPYNTYRKRGLPIGPICNPGVKSIKAVLFAGNVPYLYFVSNSDGTHHFSTSLEEHSQAVSRYRQLKKSTVAGEGSGSGDTSSP